jgi:hypothetical protein
MVARGLVLLGFRPSGMRTGQESLEEEDTLLPFGAMRVREITGQGKRIPSHLLLPVRGD